MHAEQDEIGRCLVKDCAAPVQRIERYHATVIWERHEDGAWDLGTLDTGTHFHLFCAAGHETRCWANPDRYADGTLPEALQCVVYPGKDGCPEGPGGTYSYWLGPRGGTD